MSVGPPKEKRGCYTALKTTEVAVAYRLLALLQASRRLAATRSCVSCVVRVTNRNVGGHSRKSALSGALWCYSCADDAPPIFQAIASSATD